LNGSEPPSARGVTAITTLATIVLGAAAIAVASFAFSWFAPSIGGAASIAFLVGLVLLAIWTGAWRSLAPTAVGVIAGIIGACVIVLVVGLLSQLGGP
jgi:hypothetical protein